VYKFTPFIKSITEKPSRQSNLEGFIGFRLKLYDPLTPVNPVAVAVIGTVSDALSARPSLTMRVAT
jgi:hypothetical protein